jgi:hypothetical protein
MLASGGIAGRQRITRHLWRMCFGLFIATGSFFLGQQQVFPAFLRGSIFLTILALLPFPLMIYWLFRVRFSKAYRAGPPPMAVPVAFEGLRHPPHSLGDVRALARKIES